MYNTYVVYRISIASVHTYIYVLLYYMYAYPCARVHEQTQTYYTNRSPTAAASKNRNLLQVEKLKV